MHVKVCTRNQEFWFSSDPGKRSHATPCTGAACVPGATHSAHRGFARFAGNPECCGGELAMLSDPFPSNPIQSRETRGGERSEDAMVDPLHPRALTSNRSFLGVGPTPCVR